VRKISRRVVLAGMSLGTGLAADTSPKKPSSNTAVGVAGEFARFLDPTTETTVVRLTDPRTSSLLPSPLNRSVSLKERFLLFSSDRTGQLCPFHLDLRSGVLTQIAQTADLRPESLCLDEPERGVYLLAGEQLQHIDLSGRKVHVLADGISAFSLVHSPGEFAVVRRGRLEYLSKSGPVLADNVAPWCSVRPGGNGCLFGRELSPGEREFWYAPFAASQSQSPSKLAAGAVTNPVWSANGQSIQFLRMIPTETGHVTEIREVPVDGGKERKVAATSQFVAFSLNEDNSAVVGASGSKAQPHLILLLPASGRELTLCEHRASHPAQVSQVFSPDSRRVYFQSDREGKSALYSVNIERLIEPTRS
jgi:oligogalacturonide lyase